MEDTSIPFENCPALTPRELLLLLQQVGRERAIFIWGSPGIGKTQIVEQYASSLKIPYVPLLGSQLDPTQIIGIPQLGDGTYRFCPPRYIARNEPYCLLLDEFNSCSQDIQKALYSLVLEKRIGEYIMPKGSVVIGAGNRIGDKALAFPLSSAIMNRMLHVHLTVSVHEWLEWARMQEVHPLILHYIHENPSHLSSDESSTTRAFSTPRSWHMLSDAMKKFGAEVPDRYLQVLAYGCLSADHADQFINFVRHKRSHLTLRSILAGDETWPYKVDERDLLLILAQSFRSYLINTLPLQEEKFMSEELKQFNLYQQLLWKLAEVDLWMAQMVLQKDTQGTGVPKWFCEALYKEMPTLRETGGQ